jgi:hypothetical protein
MLSPFTPLDRARLLVPVRVRLFAQMLQHGHETVKTRAHLGVLLLEHMPLAVRLVLATLRWSTPCLALICRDRVGEPASLVLNVGDDDIHPVVILNTRTHCEEVTLEHTCNAPRGVGESVGFAAYLHDVLLLR